MTYSSALSAINTPWITGSIAASAVAGFPSLKRLCQDAIIALPLIKIVNLLAISLSFYAATQPGRLDGRQSEVENKEITEFMSLRRGGTLVAPKGWAFIIWAPIFLGEFLFTFTSLFAVRDGTPVAGLLRKVSSGFIMAQVFQSLWAATFRPKYVGSMKKVTTWMSAGMLTGIAACLNQAHLAYAKSSNKKVVEQCLYFLPISLHFGWTTAAALVNWNGNLAATVAQPQALAVTGWFSALIATAVGVGITLQRSAPVYGGVICWALAACADGMSDRLAERERLVAQVKSNKSSWGFGKQPVTTEDEIIKRKGQYGAALQKWLCTVGAILSGAAAVWTTIQPQLQKP